MSFAAAYLSLSESFSAWKKRRCPSLKACDSVRSFVSICDTSSVPSSNQLVVLFVLRKTKKFVRRNSKTKKKEKNFDDISGFQAKSTESESVFSIFMFTNRSAPQAVVLELPFCPDLLADVVVLSTENLQDRATPFCCNI